MSVLPPVFPLSPSEYLAEEERAFRAKVSDAIGDRLGRFDIAVYGGVPYSSLRGSDSTFTIASGATPTVLSFNTVVKTNTDIVPSGSTVSPVYTLDALIFLKIVHDATAGGAIAVTTRILVNGSPVNVIGFAGLVSDPWVISDFSILTLAAGDVLTVDMVHGFGSSIDVNLVTSRLSLIQLTPNPKLTVLERL
jgi:hypothetical protein